MVFDDGAWLKMFLETLPQPACGEFGSFVATVESR